ncbi:MAG: GTPase Era [Desulfobacterales bacterium]
MNDSPPTLPAPPAFRSGVVTLAGPPNAGKSTLLNRILGEKLSICSPKPQTTRHRILGVCHRPGAQILFLDTPGVFHARDRLNRTIVETAWAAVAEADVLLVVLDASRPAPEPERLLAERLKTLARPVVIALNKIDLLPDKSALLPLIEHWAGELSTATVVPISALEGTQVEDLVAALTAALPEGPPYFPEDALTDAPLRFLAAEWIREKIFAFTGEEIPYAAAVTIESFEEAAGDRIRIEALIHLERESQKAIVIGRGGAMLKKIGTAARLDLERLTGKKVFLQLTVRVEKNWRKNERAIRRFGYGAPPGEPYTGLRPRQTRSGE